MVTSNIGVCVGEGVGVGCGWVVCRVWVCRVCVGWVCVRGGGGGCSLLYSIQTSR